MVGVGVGVGDLRGWPRDDGVIAFPLGDSSIVKLRKLWFVSHQKAEVTFTQEVFVEHPGQFLAHSSESVCWMAEQMNE